MAESKACIWRVRIPRTIQAKYETKKQKTGSFCHFVTEALNVFFQLLDEGEEIFLTRFTEDEANEILKTLELLKAADDMFWDDFRSFKGERFAAIMELFGTQNAHTKQIASKCRQMSATEIFGLVNWCESRQFRKASIQEKQVLE